MSDFFENNNPYSSDNQKKPENSDQPVNQTDGAESDNIYSSSDTQSKSNEGSYEWSPSSDRNPSSGTEYHYSYINGNNTDAAHNPNNYDSAYSSNSYRDPAQSSESYGSYSGADYSKSSYSSSPNGEYSDTGYGSGYSGAGSYGGYNAQNYQTPNYSAQPQPKQRKKAQKPKKPKKPASRGFVAAMLIISIIASCALGFGGGYYASRISSAGGNGGVNINQVAADSTSTKSNASISGTTSSIVKKTADSVVEIATESVVTGGFAQQYVQQGAGSGVIITEDGYIITNNHVIDGAENITVTLRDNSTSYTAILIGADEDNDIALIKVDATGLSPATFGDSNKLAVGDYVVAIGNPLGELGGTVTDGIISALAREVTVDGKNMTLLQHNAQISPGNSGGGLFNANGELIGIVNAKDSATEVEGIAFAIPVNNVLDIIEDLKTYGYVTGKIDLGMQFTDITSKESAFYYGVNKTGCYVASVERGSNAEAAGFRAGDLVTEVNGAEITSSDEISAALADSKVGDTAVFTIYRSGKTYDLNLTLDEYVPSNAGDNTVRENQDNSGDSIWDYMFGR